MNFQRFKSGMLRNVARLFSANVIVGIVSFAVYPLLTRLYSSSDFGLLNLFTSIVGVLVILSTLDLHYAIVLPKDDRDSHAIAQVALLSTVCMVLLTAFFSFFISPVANFFHVSELIHVWWLVPIMVGICATWNVFNYLFIRAKSFNYVSGYYLTQGLLIPVLKVAFALLGIVLGGLVYGSVLGSAIAVGLLAIIAFANRKFSFSTDRDLSREMFVKYKFFPLFSLPRSVVNNLSSNIPALLLTPFFGLSPVGLFGVCLAFGFRPINMLENSIYQVYYPEISELVNSKKPIRHSLRRFLKSTSFIIAPLAIVGLLVLSYAMGWLLGDQWVETGILLRMMIPWLVASLFVAPICFLSDIFGKQPQALGFEILLIACRVAGMMIGVWTNDFNYAIWGYSLGGAVAISIQFVWYLSLAFRYDKSLQDTDVQ